LSQPPAADALNLHRIVGLMGAGRLIHRRSRLARGSRTLHRCNRAVGYRLDIRFCCPPSVCSASAPTNRNPSMKSTIAALATNHSRVGHWRGFATQHGADSHRVFGRELVGQHTGARAERLRDDDRRAAFRRHGCAPSHQAAI